jgi:hypothetical protein
MRLRQRDLARRIGAANKAVVYQWESRQRRPSPVFWKRVEILMSRLNRSPAPGASNVLPTDRVRTRTIDPDGDATTHR